MYKGKQRFFVILRLSALVFLSGCGVKGKPLPPLTPADQSSSQEKEDKKLKKMERTTETKEKQRNI